MEYSLKTLLTLNVGALSEVMTFLPLPQVIHSRLICSKIKQAAEGSLTLAASRTQAKIEESEQSMEEEFGAEKVQEYKKLYEDNLDTASKFYELRSKTNNLSRKDLAETRSVKNPVDVVAASHLILMILIDGNKIEGESASLFQYKALDYSNDGKEIQAIFTDKTKIMDDIAELDICNISHTHVQEAQEVRKACPEISSDRLKRSNGFAGNAYVFCELIFAYYESLEQLKAVGANIKLDEIAHLKQWAKTMKEIAKRIKIDYTQN